MDYDKLIEQAFEKFWAEDYAKLLPLDKVSLKIAFLRGAAFALEASSLIAKETLGAINVDL